MVAKECLPSLRGRSPPPHHIFGNAGLADIDTKLEKLTMDPWRSPQRVGGAHLADQPTNFQGHGWSTAATPRFPTPIRLSIELKGSFLGQARRSTLSCCLSTTISASSAARDRKRSTIIPKNNLLHSDIEQQHGPILCQPATGSDLRQGQGPPSR